MESKLVELIDVVQAGLPEVSRQAVQAQALANWVCLGSAIAVIVGSVILLLWISKTWSQSGDLIPLTIATGFVTIFAIVFAGASIFELYSIYAFPDLAAVKATLALIPRGH